MAELSVKKRYAIRGKELRVWRDRLTKEWTVPFLPEDGVEVVTAPPYEGLAIAKHVCVVTQGPHGDHPYPTVHGLLRERPHLRWVTVDMGAIPYVTKGADVMAPGIVDADPSIQAGDLVWIRDERHGQPLAVGQAIATGVDMIQDEAKGKAVRKLHHIGDPLWNLEL